MNAMTLEQWRTYCLSFPASVEDMPFGDDVLVYKVAGKMFALLAWQADPLSMNLKCEPNWAVQLRAQHPQVTAGYHMNKRHWNTVELSGIDDALIKTWVVDSYDLVVKGLPKSVQRSLMPHDSER